MSITGDPIPRGSDIPHYLKFEERTIPGLTVNAWLEGSSFLRGTYSTPKAKYEIEYYFDKNGKPRDKRTMKFKEGSTEVKIVTISPDWHIETSIEHIHPSKESRGVYLTNLSFQQNTLTEETVANAHYDDDYLDIISFGGKYLEYTGNDDPQLKGKTFWEAEVSAQASSLPSNNNWEYMTNGTDGYTEREIRELLDEKDEDLAIEERMVKQKNGEEIKMVIARYRKGDHIDVLQTPQQIDVKNIMNTLMTETVIDESGKPKDTWRNPARKLGVTLGYEAMLQTNGGNNI